MAFPLIYNSKLLFQINLAYQIQEKYTFTELNLFTMNVPKCCFTLQVKVKAVNLSS